MHFVFWRGGIDEEIRILQLDPTYLLALVCLLGDIAIAASLDGTIGRLSER